MLTIVQKRNTQCQRSGVVGVQCMRYKVFDFIGKFWPQVLISNTYPLHNSLEYLSIQAFVFDG